jgi:hypothetical protein
VVSLLLTLLADGVLFLSRRFCLYSSQMRCHISKLVVGQSRRWWPLPHPQHLMSCGYFFFLWSAVANLVWWMWRGGGRAAGGRDGVRMRLGRGWSGVVLLSICSSSVSCSSQSLNDNVATFVSNFPNAAMSSLFLEYSACTLERRPCDFGSDVTSKLRYFILAWSLVGMSLPVAEQA